MTQLLRLLLLSTFVLVALPIHAEEQPERTIVLVRHGAYDSARVAASGDGPDLTPLGVAQAKLAGARLAALPGPWTRILSSTMTRARETAAVIKESMPLVPLEFTDLLRECTPPETDSPDEESIKCQQRLDQAFRLYFAPTARGQKEIFVCHGNVIRYLVTKALGVDTRSWVSMSVAHASLTVIKVGQAGRISVLSVGDVGHIPPNLQSGTTATTPSLSIQSAEAVPSKP